MNNVCLKCGRPATGRFRPVMGRGRMERLCPDCADQLSTMVRMAGETALLSLANDRFVAWLETGRWPTRNGSTIGPEDVTCDSHGPECPCCATFAEEEN